MQKLQDHLRRTFLAGIFAAVPVVVTVFLIWYVDHNTRVISEKLLGRSIPFLGIVVALVAIYLGGLVATTLLGKWIVALVDRLLSRLPGFKHLYAAWKQIALTPGGGEGMFARVVLVADAEGHARMLGFTSGQAVRVADPIVSANTSRMASSHVTQDTLCVFVPNAPNPLQGRLIFVERARCAMLSISAEEAFKMLLSTGNYLPADLGALPEPAVRSAPAI